MLAYGESRFAERTTPLRIMTEDPREKLAPAPSRTTSVSEPELDPAGSVAGCHRHTGSLPIKATVASVRMSVHGDPGTIPA